LDFSQPKSPFMSACRHSRSCGNRNDIAEGTRDKLDLTPEV
jgi:hypothetical protein